MYTSPYRSDPGRRSACNGPDQLTSDLQSFALFAGACRFLPSPSPSPMGGYVPILREIILGPPGKQSLPSARTSQVT
jgi:hypothetical protein